MTTPALPYALISVVLLIGLTQRLYALACDRTDPLRRAVCVVLAGLLMATVAQLFTAAVDRVTGIVHLGAGLSDMGAMVAACAGRQFLLHIGHSGADLGRRARRCYLGLAVALAATAVLFVTFPPRPDQANPIYMVVYIAYTANVLIGVVGMGICYSGRTDRPFLGWGLRVLAAGSTVGLAFIGAQGAVLVSGLAAAPAASLIQLTTVLELVTEVLLLAGVTMTAWGPALAELRQWLADLRSYRRLRPLWRALHEANPGFALLPADRLWPRDIGLLLYRQVIEIRDGQFAIRPYADPAATTRADSLARQAGLTTVEARAVVEATAIASGIAAKADGRPADNVAATDWQSPSDTGLTAEIAWLRSVARAFARSPIVRASVESLPGNGFADVGAM